MLLVHFLSRGSSLAFDRGFFETYISQDQKERLPQYGQTYRRVQVVSLERNASPHTNLPSQVVFLRSLQKKVVHKVTNIAGITLLFPGLQNDLIYEGVHLSSQG